MNSFDLIAHAQSQSDSKDTTVQLCTNTDSTRPARNALVQEPSATLNRNSTTVTSISTTTQAVQQPGVSQQPPVSQFSCLTSRSQLFQEQGFSAEVAERIAAPF